jgi:hypothetical protein
MKKCKICEADDSIRQAINELCKNASFKEAAIYAKENKIMVSATSIEVHYNKHDLVHPNQTNQPNQSISKIEPSKTISKDLNVNESNELVISILLDHRKIVKQLTEKYNVDGFYHPKNEIYALKTLETMYGYKLKGKENKEDDDEDILEMTRKAVTRLLRDYIDNKCKFPMSEIHALTELEKTYKKEYKQEPADLDAIVNRMFEDDETTQKE